MRNVTERKKSAETFGSALPWSDAKNYTVGDNGRIERSILPDKDYNRVHSLPDLFLS